MVLKGQYSGYFLGATFVVLAVLDLIALIILFTLFGISKYRARKKFTPGSKVQDDEFEDEDINEEEYDLRERQISWREAIYLTLIWILVLDIAFLLWMLVAWNLLPIGAGIPLMTIYLWVAWCFLMPLDGYSFGKAEGQPWYRYQYETIRRKIQFRPILFVCGLFGWFVFAFITCFFTEGICIGFDPISVTTKFSRSVSQKKVCDDSGICHLFLTLPEDPSTSMIVNFHTGEDTKLEAPIPTVFYDLNPHAQEPFESYNFSQTGTSWTYTTCDGEPRGVHWVELTGLTPNTTYFFKVGVGADISQYSKEYRFRTLPSTGPVTFITGGDLGISQTTRDMMMVAASLNPSFIILGGDIAYSNAMDACYGLWDTFTDWWGQHMVTKDGCLIPLSMAIGNHEAGGYGTSPSDIPIFLDWYPQQIGVTRQERSTYHRHLISDNGLLLILDSDISTLSDGTNQQNWIEQEFQNYPNRYAKFTSYHVPLFPSYRAYDGEPSKSLRSKWIPLFDQYNLTVGFENHDHAYKRTKMIRNLTVVEDGPFYVGDGAWGVPPRSLGSVVASERWYTDFAESRNFVIQINMDANWVNVTSIDINNVVFDQFSRKL